LIFRQRLRHLIARSALSTTMLCSHDGVGNSADEGADWNPHAHDLTGTVGPQNVKMPN
jgi:hypothetical protein